MVPPELFEAVVVALDREAAEHDIGKRSRLLRTTRATLDAWLRGWLATPEAVLRLRSDIEAH
jgi:hypothetical protein